MIDLIFECEVEGHFVPECNENWRSCLQLKKRVDSSERAARVFQKTNTLKLWENNLKKRSQSMPTY